MAKKPANPTAQMFGEWTPAAPIPATVGLAHWEHGKVYTNDARWGVATPSNLPVAIYAYHVGENGERLPYTWQMWQRWLDRVVYGC